MDDITREELLALVSIGYQTRNGTSAEMSASFAERLLATWERSLVTQQATLDGTMWQK